MHVRTTHDSVKLEDHAQQYIKLLYSTVTGSSAAEGLKSSGLSGTVKPERDDLRVVYQDFGPACYIDSSFPVTAHLFLKCASYTVVLYSVLAFQKHLYTRLRTLLFRAES